MPKIFYSGQEVRTLESSLDLLVKAEMHLSIEDFHKYFNPSIAQHLFRRFAAAGVVGTYRTLDDSSRKLFLRMIQSDPDEGKVDKSVMYKQSNQSAYDGASVNRYIHDEPVMWSSPSVSISDAHIAYLTEAMDLNNKGLVISDMEIRDIKAFMRLRYTSVLNDVQIAFCRKLRSTFPDLDAEVSKEFENKDQD